MLRELTAEDKIELMLELQCINRPMAAEGLTSYRYKGHYGYVMIGATDDVDALRQAQRSVSAPVEACRLQKWNGVRYE